VKIHLGEGCPQGSGACCCGWFANEVGGWLRTSAWPMSRINSDSTWSHGCRDGVRCGQWRCHPEALHLFLVGWGMIAACQGDGS
jgi:hypothetical protein